MNSRKNKWLADASYMGLLLLLFICIIYIAAYSDHISVSIMALCAVFAVMIVTHFTSVTLGLIINIVAIFIVVTILLYQVWNTGASIDTEWYFWMVMSPVMTLVSHLVFWNIGQLEAENKELKKYAKEFILVDAGSGLKNRQAYKMEMSIYQRISQRYGMKLMLIVWEFKYEDDLRRMMGSKSMRGAVRQISKTMEGLFRKEDVIYIMSDHPYRWGTIMLTKEGVEEILMERMRKKFEAMDLSEVMGKNAPRLEMRIGLTYATEEETAMTLYQRAVNELQYDV